MKQKETGGWGYHSFAGVAVLAHITGCTLVEAHPASLLYPAVVHTADCMLERVHPSPALVHTADCMLERVHPSPALVDIADCLQVGAHPAPQPSRVHMRMY